MLIIRRKEPKQKNRNRQKKKKQRAARGAVHNHIGRL
jgi:hypothetical protein